MLRTLKNCPTNDVLSRSAYCCQNKAHSNVRQTPLKSLRPVPRTVHAELRGLGVFAARTNEQHHRTPRARDPLAGLYCSKRDSKKGFLCSSCLNLSFDNTSKSDTRVYVV